MLKPKHCYANEDTYNYHLFLHTGTIRAYALNPHSMTQVKFILHNEKTKELKCDNQNRFFFVNREGRSRFFYSDDAKSILQFLEIIKLPNISDYTDPISRVKYHSLENGNKCEWVSVSIGNSDERIIDNSSIGSPRDTIKYIETRKSAFIDMCARLKEVLEEFIRITNHDIPLENNIPYHFKNEQFTVLPLINKQNGWTASSCLRLQVIKRDQEELKNSICLSYKGKDVLFYSRDSHIKDSSSIFEVVEGFITGLKTLVNDYHNHYDDANFFIKAIPIPLSEDRKHFMEYVGGRGVGGDGHDGPYRTMIINVNSDAAPGSSKVNFHYHPEFMEDLYNGLRFLLNL